MPRSSPDHIHKPLVMQQVCFAPVLRSKLAATICSVFPILRRLPIGFL
jgi:hypothetical protein